MDLPLCLAPIGIDVYTHGESINTHSAYKQKCFGTQAEMQKQGHFPHCSDF